MRIYDENIIIVYIIMSKEWSFANTRSGEKLNAFLKRQQANQNSLFWKKSFFYKDKNRKIAWIKYYDEIRENHHLKARNYALQKKIFDNFDLTDDDDDGIAKNIQNELFDMVKELKKDIECPICFEPILDRDCLHITSCGHKFCVECRTKITDCAMCRKKIGKYRKPTKP